MKKIVLAVIVGAMLALGLAACSSQPASSGSESASAASESASASAASELPATPSEEELATLIVDEQAKSISAWAQINGKYQSEPTHHFQCNKDGSNGEKAVMRAWVTPDEVYEALISLGAKPGDNLTADDKGGFIEGDKLNVTLEWNGSNGPVAMADCLKRLDGSAYEADIRFGGNKESNKEFGTGCISCTFSCPAGIISNAAYPYGSEDVMGNSDVLPPDGTYVLVTYTLA